MMVRGMGSFHGEAPTLTLEESGVDVWGRQFQSVFDAIGPYEVTILPPEQRLFGVNANTILTLGIGVLAVGLVLSMVRR